VSDSIVTQATGGRLMQLLSARGGTAVDAPTMVLQHREALIYTLGKAAALEQLVMCQYLYAAFSMKDRDDDGLTDDQLTAVKRWRRELIHIAEQEMLHLALVQNLLTAVGAGSALERPNFPLPVHAYPAGIRMELLPFSEESMRHFIYLERPEGMDMDDQDALAAASKAAPLPTAHEDDIGPRLQDFATIGELYRAIEVGFDRLTERLGEDRLFVGPRDAQAIEGHYALPGLAAVTNLASARAAIDTIVEQGEGARGAWRDAHFGRLVVILDEYLDLRDQNPSFEPSRPVLAACVRAREDGAPVPLISDPFTSRCVDLMNAVYEVTLQLLARYFAHTDETEEQCHQATRRTRDATAGGLGVPGPHRRTHLRAVLRRGLPAPPPERRVDRHGGADARRRGARDPLQGVLCAAVHAGAHEDHHGTRRPRRPARGSPLIYVRHPWRAAPGR